MAVDEMAWSSAEIDKATSDVDAGEEKLRSKRAEEEYLQLYNDLARAINKAGGTAVLQQTKDSHRDDLIDPYNRQVAIIWKLLSSTIGRLMPQDAQFRGISKPHWPIPGLGPAKTEFGAIQVNDSAGLKQAEHHWGNLIKALTAIADFGAKQQNAPARSSAENEPYLTVQNAKTLQTWINQLPRALKAPRRSRKPLYPDKAVNKSGMYEEVSNLEKIVGEELSAVIKEANISPQDLRKMDPRAALRVGGGDDKSLRKAIADFITMGGEDREEVLAQAIGKYQYSDKYLVTLAQQLLAKGLARAAPEKRIQVAKSVEGDLSEDKDWIQKAVDPDHEGYCTPMTKPTCTPKRKALAKRFKKAAKKKDREGGTGWQGKV